LSISKTMLKKTITRGFAVALVIVFVLFSSPGSTALDGKIRNAIIVAYMNGFVDALDLNIDKIKGLKSNQDRLKKTVKEATARYIETVEKMNKN
jgi:hypothetical protein